MTKCPVCGALLDAGTSCCRRCKSDLSLLVDVVAGAERLLARSVRFLTDGDFESASEAANEAVFLRRTPEAVMLQRFIDSHV